MKFSFKKNNFLIYFLILVLLIVLLNVFQKETRSFFYSFSSPIQSFFWKIGDRTAAFSSGLLSPGNLSRRAEELEKENQGLLFQIISLKELGEENKILRQAFDLDLQEEFKLSLAEVTSKDISQDYILINKGFDQGVFVNMPVITEQKILVGRVAESYNKISKVMLIFNKESSFDAKILSEQDSLVSGVVRGAGKSSLLLDFIPREKDIKEGDIVITASLGGIFPNGLLVGKIKEINRSDVESFQQAAIDPFLDISSLDRVFIIKEF